MVTCKGPKANLNTSPNMQRVDSFQIGGVPGKHSQAEGNNYTEEKRDELKTMAGSLVVYEGDSLGNSVTSIKYQSEVQFSRFFNHVSVSTACPILIPYKKKARSRGTWMSSTPSSSNVFLQIRTDYSCSEPILAIYLGEKLLEEHFIYKLCFSWPHVSCVLGFPARASRIILVSYRACVGQMQKFALRFSTICQTEKFMKSLKDILNVKGDKGFPSERSCSEISCFAPSNRTQNRDGEKSSIIRPTESCCPEMLPSLTYEVEHCSNSPENGLNYSASRDSEKSSSATPSEVYVPQIEPSLACEVNHNADDTFAALPPSFASLLSNCYSQATQAKPAMSVEDDLKSQIMKCLEDSSFQDILSKVEKIVNGLGDDFML